MFISAGANCRWSTVLLTAGVAWLAGCGRHAEPRIAVANVEEIHVTYKPSTHALSVAEAKDLILGISPNGAGYLLDGKNPAAAGYKAGDSLLVKGLVARSIFAADRTEDGSVILLTQQARLTDVIQDGTIRISKPIHFGAAAQASNRLRSPDLLSLLVPTAAAANGDAAGGIHGNSIHNLKGIPMAGWTVDTTLTTEAPDGLLNADGQLKILIELTRNEPGFRGRVAASGFLKTFAFDSDISIASGAMEKLKSSLQNVNGELTIEWELATEAHGFRVTDDHIKLPPLLKVPLSAVLEGLPVYLNLTSAIILKPALSGGGEYTHGAFKLTYSGSEGMDASVSGLTPTGNVTGDIERLKTQNISATAPLGMVVAFAAPRIELVLGLGEADFLPSMITKGAVGAASAATDWLASKALSAEQYARYKVSPAGSVSLAATVDDLLKSEADAYFEIVTSIGMSTTGVSVMTPCTRHDIHLAGRVGAEVTVSAQDVGRPEAEVFKKDLVQIDPPGTQLCESVGT